MSKLEFLGWVLDGAVDGAREYFAPPAPGMWGARVLYVEQRGGRHWLGTDDEVLKFKLDQLEIELEFDRDGTEVAPAPAGRLRLMRSDNRLFIRMGKPATQPGAYRFRIGPGVFADGSWQALQFGADGAVIVPLSVQRYFILDLADGLGSENPLVVQLGPGSMTLNLQQRSLSLSQEALTARLRNARANESHANRALEMFSQPLSCSFKELAAQAPLAVQFRARPGNAAPVCLNVARTGALPEAGLEVLQCGLRLTFEKAGSGATALLSEADLAPLDGRPIRLRLMGIWNSRNQAEEWSCATPLPLAFRIGRSRSAGADQDQWSAAVLRPGAEVLGGLIRLNGSLPGKTTPLPMHGVIPGAQFRLSGATAAALVRTVAASDKDAPLPAREWRAAKLMCGQSRPWLRLSEAELHYPRPGDAYGNVEPWVFRGAPGGVSGGVPAIPLANWRDGAAAPLAAANQEIDASYKACALATMAGVHETGLVDASDNQGRALPKIVALMPRDALAATMQTLVLEKHVKTLQLAAPPPAGARAAAVLSLSVATPPLEAGFEYSVCWDGARLPSATATFALKDWPETLMTKLDMAVPVKVGLLKNDGSRLNALPFAILKLGRQRGLEAILRELAAYAPAQAAAQTPAALGKVIDLIAETDAAVLAASWVGLVAFSVPLDFSEFTALEQTIPLGQSTSPRLEFLALGSRRGDTGTAADSGAVSAAVSWRSPYDQQAHPPVYDKPESEVSLWPSLLDMRFRQGQMTAFKAALQLEFRAFFGMGHPAAAAAGAALNNLAIQVLGSARKTDPSAPNSPVEFQFVADSKSLTRIYPIGKAAADADKESFLEGVWFKRLELVDTVAADGRRQSQIRINGEIELRKPDNFSLAGQFLSKIEGRRIAFLNLGIDIPGPPRLDPRLLKISYPSLSFNLDLPHVELFGNALRMKLSQLALNWNGGFDFPGMSSLNLGTPGWRSALPNLVFIGRLDFGSLPAMFARSLSGFSLELGLGLNFDPATASLGSGRELFVRGFGFDGLDFDLLQFLRVKIDRLRLGALPSAPGAPKGASLTLGGATVQLLRYTIFDHASGGFFSREQGGGEGFWAYFPASQGNKFLLFFDWGFVAKNVDFAPEVAKTLLVPPPLNQISADADTGLATGKQLELLWDQGKIGPATDVAGRGWTFAAGLTVLGGSLRGRALIQDSGFAGLSVWGDELKKWFGYDFSFCGIYRRNLTPGEDYFYISTTLPAVTLGTIHFTGGVVALEIYTSGDFMVDFGFPWPGANGGREWLRTIGAIVTPGQASAGFYLRKRETRLDDAAGGGTLLTISAGFAVQWGLGAAFGGGTFTAWVRIGLYAVLEGVAALRIHDHRLDLQTLIVSGAGGVLVEGEGAIDWWVISVRIHVCASAEISLTLSWQAGGATTLALRAELYVSASAEACVGGGWFKLCRSIRVGLSIPVTHQLTF
ncbi:hypothetical protein [Rugamonas aquatica]|uniref:Uncharacterized protein n=1 Tax=Rugamonas aquatica TaxID=2743357 RepID=A0A6A7N1I5_9BURK|nr:hypothetical protein [Rugamonas aquatica]MQA38934.1 hypothetical protein [Rugamonas aquatica]